MAKQTSVTYPVNGKTYVLKVWDEGINFACRGGVFHANGRKITETRAYPHGQRFNALEAAKALAERHATTGTVG